MNVEKPSGSDWAIWEVFCLMLSGMANKDKKQKS
ncbi:hypothetical protein M2132_001739 [Dysgonomonas sp. PH5-45]|nr:hypothetical protein [Dysgonomonas sp. PH5-45]